MSNRACVGLAVVAVIAVGVAIAVGIGCASAQCHGGGMPTVTAPPASAPASQASQPAGKFVNVRCPIMGSAIDPARVTGSLTRDYNGQKVAFCCGMCPSSWDKLTPEEKASKLKAVQAR